MSNDRDPMAALGLCAGAIVLKMLFSGDLANLILGLFAVVIALIWYVGVPIAAVSLAFGWQSNLAWTRSARYFSAATLGYSVVAFVASWGLARLWGAVLIPVFSIMAWEDLTPGGWAVAVAPLMMSCCAIQWFVSTQIATIVQHRACSVCNALVAYGAYTALWLSYSYFLLGDESSLPAGVEEFWFAMDIGCVILGSLRVKRKFVVVESCP